MLLVDDEASFREDMSRRLRSQGYEVDAVADGLAAIDLVRQAKNRYDVALIDRTLADGPDGIETMKQIRSEDPDLYAIVIAEWADVHTGLEALREGAYRYMSKPLDLDELDIIIHAIQELREDQRELRGLHPLLETLKFMQLGDVERVLQQVVDGIQVALRCDVVTLFKVDDVRKVFTGSPVVAGSVYGLDNMLENVRTETHRGSLAGRILELGEYFAEDASSDPVLQGQFVSREEVKSAGGIALRSAEHLLGVLFISYRHRHYFTEREKELIRAYAAQAAVAIRNAELYEGEKKRGEYYRALQEAGSIIAASIDKDEIFNALLEKALDITAVSGTRALFASLWSYDAERNRLEMTHVQPPNAWQNLGRKRDQSIAIELGVDRSIGIAGRTIKAKTPQWVKDVRSDPDYFPVLPEISSEIAVPLMSGDRVIGVLDVEHALESGLDEYDADTLVTLATQAVLAIQKAEYIEELQQTQELLQARTALAWMQMGYSARRHRVGNRASAIIWQVDTVRSDALDSATRQRLERIRDLAEEIVQEPDVQPLSDQVGVEAVPINKLLRERFEQLWQNEPYKSVRYQMDLDLEDNVYVRANREWLIRVVDILVDNSVQAMARSRSKLITVSTRRKNSRAEIAITDRGRGIPENIQDKLFKESIAEREGLGIGLLMAQTIVQAFGGEIHVRETGPRGTTMMIALPAEV